MSYERDSDRKTRGVGAIAASDQVLPMNRRRAIDLARGTQRRDQRVIATGLGSAVLFRRASDPEPGQQGKQGTPTAPATPIVRDHRTATTAPAPGGPPPAAPPVVHQAPSLSPGSYPTSPTAPPVVAVVAAPVAQPVALPPAVPGTVRTVVVSGGGSGGVVVGSKGPGLVLTAPAITPLPDLDLTSPPAANNTVRNVAIAGGAALVAYLLLFRGNK